MMADRMERQSRGVMMTGWEKDRLRALGLLFEKYREIDEEALFDHLDYFLNAIIPTAEECGIKMAIHPDDPPWPVFGLPRISPPVKKIWTASSAS